jgi:hypothetical protein
MSIKKEPKHEPDRWGGAASSHSQNITKRYSGAFGKPLVTISLYNSNINEIEENTVEALVNCTGAQFEQFGTPIFNKLKFLKF